MATVKRYPLNSLAINELLGDLEKMRDGLAELPQTVVADMTERAEKQFNDALGIGTTPGRQAVISTQSALVHAAKGEATGRLTATGKTEDTGFNILMAVEFGAGIAGIDGLSNPDYPQLPYGTGTWPGQTHAFDHSGWFYPADDGSWKHTYGTPAAMPMHYTIEYVKADMPRMVREEVRKWLTT